MKRLPVKLGTLAVLAIVIPLIILFIYVSLRSGPLAPIPVTTITVENKSITPALFGIGTVEVQYTYSIGPVSPGRIQQVNVQVGDYVKHGQVLGTMDPVDIDDRIRAQDAALKRGGAQLKEAQARQEYAKLQAVRYEGLLEVHSSSEEMVEQKRQELIIANAAIESAREELVRIGSDRQALQSQKRLLQLISPVDGLVVARYAEPGTTLLAGQAVLELIDPASLWVHVRIDQIHAHGLSAGLPARIHLRSRNGAPETGHVYRIEPLADSVTEEILAKVRFDRIPDPRPSIGELAEVTVTLDALPAGPVIPNAALKHFKGHAGVWQIHGETLKFTPVTTEATDLEGHIQISSGLKAGDRIILHSAKTLNARSRITRVDQLTGKEK